MKEENLEALSPRVISPREEPMHIRKRYLQKHDSRFSPFNPYGICKGNKLGGETMPRIMRNLTISRGTSLEDAKSPNLSLLLSCVPNQVSRYGFSATIPQSQYAKAL